MFMKRYCSNDEERRLHWFMCISFQIYANNKKAFFDFLCDQTATFNGPMQWRNQRLAFGKGGGGVFLAFAIGTPKVREI